MRFVVDAGAVIHLAREGVEVSPEHELLAPTFLRSETLNVLHEAVARGELADEEARELLERIWKLPIRLLGDAVLRRSAWKAATRLGWTGTYAAEYVALTQLQGDALVTLDPELARAAAALVETAPIESLNA